MNDLATYVEQEGLTLVQIGIVLALVLIPVVHTLLEWQAGRFSSRRLALMAFLFSAIVGSLFCSRCLTVIIGFLLFTNLLCLAKVLSRPRRASRHHARIDELAIISLQQQIIRRPDDADAYDALGEAYLAQAQYDAAIAAFEKVVKLRPNLSGEEQRKINRAQRAKEARLRQDAALRAA